MAIDVEAYYKRYGPMVFRRCKQLLKDEMKAEDAMQEVFVRLMRYEKSLKGDYPSSLLYRIATNVSLNMIRSEVKKRERLDDDLLSFIASYEDEFEKRYELRDLLNRIFKSEKESTRTMAVLHWVDELTLKEVAKELGLSVSGVRKRLRLMKDRVKKLNLRVD